MAERRKIGFGTILMVILAVCVVAYVVSAMRTAGDIPYSELRQYFLEEKVQEFSISDTRITAKLKGGSTVTSDLYDFDLFYQDLNELVQKQYDSGIITAYNYHADHSTNWLQLLLPYVLAFLGFILLMNLMNRMAGGGAGAQDKLSRFGEAKVSTPGEKKVTFQDVAGADEEKEELREIVEFLREPQKYLDLGAHIPKGVLLVGPPGTGKTLLAKAVAGEAGVQFLSISGSDFVEMYVGVGASRVRDLFQQAKKSAPAIIFIDEIDAVGRQRGSGLGGGHDEREQTLNQLLAELDGFDPGKGIIVLGATNRPEVLDKALLRPGRFDRRITVDRPNLAGRLATLQVHTRSIHLAEDVNLEKIAQATAGCVGADLANLVNEAALRAVRDGRRFATQADLEESIEVVIAGYQKKNAIMTDHEKKIVAYHEIGHALVAAMQTHSAPVQKITIVPRTSGALGYTMQVEEGNHYLMTKEEMENKIATLTGGRAAEEVAFGSVTTGASNDIEQATKLARAMITRYGMSDDFGMVALETVTNQYLGGDASLACSADTQTKIDQQVVELVKREHDKAVDILTANREKLDRLAAFLYEKETITGEEFMEILNREPAQAQ